MSDFSVIFVGKITGSSGVVLSLADAASTTKYQAVKVASSGNLSILSRNGGSETESAGTVAANVGNIVALELKAKGGLLTLTNLSTGLSTTLADTAPTTTFRYGVGCVAGSTVAQIAAGMTWNALYPFRKALSSAHRTTWLNKIKAQLLGELGVTVS